MPILYDLLKSENSEVKLNVISGLVKVAQVIGNEILNKEFITTLSNLTKDAQWRVRYEVYILVADLGIAFGKKDFTNHVQFSRFSLPSHMPNASIMTLFSAEKPLAT